MKMNHKKFLALTSALGLSVSLLSGCGIDVPNQTKTNEEEQKEEKKDEVRKDGSPVVAPIVPGKNKDRSSGLGKKSSPSGASS